MPSRSEDIVERSRRVWQQVLEWGNFFHDSLLSPQMLVSSRQEAIKKGQTGMGFSVLFLTPQSLISFPFFVCLVHVPTTSAFRLRTGLLGSRAPLFLIIPKLPSQMLSRLGQVSWTF
jgi:hypothetical protein